MRPGNNVVKQNSHKTIVTFLPIPVPHTQSPPTPQHQPTAELRPLSRPSYRPSTHAFTALSLSLSLRFISLSLPHSDLGCLLFCSLTLEVHWRRKRGMRKKSKASSVSRTLPDSILPAIAMVAWPQKQPKRSTALEKREIENCRYWMANVRFPKVLLFVSEMTCLSTFELNFMA